MEEFTCFNCGRDLGPQLEWKKMDTERGAICYVCFNEVMGDSPREVEAMNQAVKDTDSINKADETVK